MVNIPGCGRQPGLLENKAALNRDGLQESEEGPLAEDLLKVSNAIKRLEDDRKKICEELQTATR